MSWTVTLYTLLNGCVICWLLSIITWGRSWPDLKYQPIYDLQYLIYVYANIIEYYHRHTWANRYAQPPNVCTQTMCGNSISNVDGAIIIQERDVIQL